MQKKSKNGSLIGSFSSMCLYYTLELSESYRMCFILFIDKGLIVQFIDFQQVPSGLEMLNRYYQDFLKVVDFLKSSPNVLKIIKSKDFYK